MAILHGEGNGQLHGPRYLYAGEYPGSVVVRDVNGDGLVDLVVGNEGFGQGVVTVLLGKGGGAFGEALKTRLEPGSSVGDVVCVDLDGDGRPDVAATDSSNNRVAVLDNTGICGPAATDAGGD